MLIVALLVAACSERFVVTEVSDVLTQASSQWRRLDTQGIEKALNSRSLRFSQASQDFKASGRILYDAVAGEVRWGDWRAVSDQLCSRWPPVELWHCYDLSIHQRGLQLKFTDEQGVESVGKYIDLY